MLKRKQTKVRKFPAKQGKFEGGYGNPPKDHQFKPGESGNPKGPPKRRTNLWVWFCKYMELTRKQIEKLDRDKLTAAQLSALTMVEKTMNGQYTASERLAKHVFDREEGKPTEYMVVGGNDNVLSDEKCEEIRKLLQKRC
jgi:hypothetical protein